HLALRVVAWRGSWCRLARGSDMIASCRQLSPVEGKLPVV
ncbi:hypothetical protein A2U01_0087413, partial [Trifolium medium]|nr:hypothetical protein [Trifolium medium]